MNLSKIKEDAEIASIDYYDRYKVGYDYWQQIQWIVRDRTTKEDKVVSEYGWVSHLPKAARKYRKCCRVVIHIWGLENSMKYEVADTIVDKINVLKDYSYYQRPSYLDYGSYIEIKYWVTDGIILSVPKRTK